MHVYKGRDFTESIALSAVKYGCGAAQIFTHGPRSRKSIVHSSIVTNLHLYVHSTYLTNLNKEDEQHTMDQLMASTVIGSRGLVIHIPKKPYQVVAAAVKSLYDLQNKHGNDQKIILEMRATLPDTDSYETPEKLNKLIHAVRDYGIGADRVGICIDTAHIYAGRVAIRTNNEAKKYLSKFDTKDVALIHLNGNEYDCKKMAKDKHAIPLSSKDKIWGQMEYNGSGCKAFVNWSIKNGIDIIIEHKWHDTDDSELLEFIKCLPKNKVG
jgi:endonuclease IV